MSIVNYIATPTPLLEGEFGKSNIIIEKIDKNSDNTIIINGKFEIDSSFIPLDNQKLNWFQDNVSLYEGDFDTITEFLIQSIPNNFNNIKKQFTNKYIYEITSATKINTNILSKLLDYNKIKDGYIELYCSWASEEGKQRNTDTDRTVKFKSMKKLGSVNLELDHYIKIII